MATAAMGLTLPQVGVTTGAVAAQDIVDNFNIIDVHDHSSGKGSQVVAAGININAALSFGNQKAYNLLCTQFTSQSSSPTGAGDRPNVHVLNGDLYYVNSSGTAVQITNAGSIAGTSGSIGGLSSPASAQFATNAFTWKATATEYAKMEFSEISLYPFTSSPSTFLTLKVSNSVTSYTITFPDAAPASTVPLTMTSGGVIATTTNDAIGQGMTSTGANAIAVSRTRSTGTSVGAGGIAIAANSGSFVGTGAITNQSVTIITSGRPVLLVLQPGANTGSGQNVSANSSGGTRVQPYMRTLLKRGGTTLANFDLGVGVDMSSGVVSGAIFSSQSCVYVDAVAAGTYTYTAELATVSTSGTTGTSSAVLNCQLVAYEL
jgi:hypothetical protein